MSRHNGKCTDDDGIFNHWAIPSWTNFSDVGSVAACMRASHMKMCDAATSIVCIQCARSCKRCLQSSQQQQKGGVLSHFSPQKVRNLAVNTWTLWKVFQHSIAMLWICAPPFFEQKRIPIWNLLKRIPHLDNKITVFKLGQRLKIEYNNNNNMEKSSSSSDARSPMHFSCK